MRTKKDPNKLILIGSALFVGIMLALSIVLYAVGSTPAQAEAMNVAPAPAPIELKSLDPNADAAEQNPLSLLPEDVTLDVVEMDELQTQDVPEPASLTLLGLGGIALLKRRSRKA